MSECPVIVWLRQDLRLADNDALAAAAARRVPVIPVYIWAPEEEDRWAPGTASRWWLSRSLARLDRSLRRLGSRLVLRSGPSLEALRDLVRSTGARALFWNRRYEPAAVARDAAVARTLETEGIEVRTFNSSLLFEPGSILNGSGGPYRVFTPFWNACLARMDLAKPAPAPRRLRAPASWPRASKLERLPIESRTSRTRGFETFWEPGEEGAEAELQRFLAAAMEAYPGGRDRPGERATSRLSPHLHFGEIGPRRVARQVGSAVLESPAARAVPGEAFVRQIGWREFAYHLLHHFPESPERPLDASFDRIRWSSDEKALRAWQEGRTGFPMVDAGMRELLATGWMHNRVRMIVASFLVKDLLIPWQAGAAWFWDTLVDADLANNTLGWQWTAGCGADAAPFVRVFNPALQGRRFDPDGEYVRRFVPELSRLPAGRIHQPRSNGGRSQALPGMEEGYGYPEPIVDHADSRRRALEAYRRARSSRRADA